MLAREQGGMAQAPRSMRPWAAIGVTATIAARDRPENSAATSSGKFFP